MRPPTTAVIPYIGAKVISHGRYVAFQMAEVAIPNCPQGSL
jgi:hypothetical protein